MPDAALLTASAYSHLEGHMRAAEQDGICTNGQWSVHFAVSDLKHTSMYVKHAAVQHMPRPTCTSKLFNLVEQQPVMPAQLWLAQGFPHPDPAIGLSKDLTKWFPLPLDCLRKTAELDDDEAAPSQSSLSRKRRKLNFSSFTMEQQQVFIGNSMHWSLIAWTVVSFMANADKAKWREAVAKSNANRRVESVAGPACSQ